MVRSIRHFLYQVRGKLGDRFVSQSSLTLCQVSSKQLLIWCCKIAGMEGSTVQTVSTPVSTRIPAEDNTLDYTYDNAALQVTPVGDKPKSERPF